MFDGHGGVHAADLCVDYVPKYLANALANAGPNLDRQKIESILIDCFASADQEYIRRALAMGCTLNDTTNLALHMEHKSFQSAGTTACVVRALPARSRTSPSLSNHYLHPAHWPARALCCAHHGACGEAGKRAAPVLRVAPTHPRHRARPAFAARIPTHTLREPLTAPAARVGAGADGGKDALLRQCGGLDGGALQLGRQRRRRALPHAQGLRPRRSPPHPSRRRPREPPPLRRTAAAAASRSAAARTSRPLFPRCPTRRTHPPPPFRGPVRRCSRPPAEDHGGGGDGGRLRR
jgi:hypothetical protein